MRASSLRVDGALRYRLGWTTHSGPGLGPGGKRAWVVAGPVELAGVSGRCETPERLSFGDTLFPARHFRQPRPSRGNGDSTAGRARCDRPIGLARTHPD